MNARISFSPDQADQAAKSIKTKGDSAQGVINQLEKEIHSLQDWWKGESANAFIGEFDQLKPSLNKLVECVRGISDQLTKIAQIKRESENDIAKQLRGR